MITQVVSFNTPLSFDEIVAIATKRAPEFRAIKGLVQKYYVRIDENRYGGVYLWETAEALEAFRASDLAKTIPSAYQISGAPDVQIGQMIFALRENELAA